MYFFSGCLTSRDSGTVSNFCQNLPTNQVYPDSFDAVKDAGCDGVDDYPIGSVAATSPGNGYRSTRHRLASLLRHLSPRVRQLENSSSAPASTSSAKVTTEPPLDWAVDQSTGSRPEETKARQRRNKSVDLGEETAEGNRDRVLETQKKGRESDTETRMKDTADSCMNEGRMQARMRRSKSPAFNLLKR
ncbi:unnamed protein product [Protopolystoma xenopodis]|uniref:Uncharacterized protein n=1 Tax=Protopolystoma xenopodis TaxID=117903 RepID=A0A3S5CJA8_9PLAT|nr:unnamed protein product [Protopolystoma xenopodis]